MLEHPQSSPAIDCPTRARMKSTLLIWPWDSTASWTNSPFDESPVRGGLLDVVATRRDDDTPLPVTVYDADLSDHHLLLWSIPISRPPAPVISVVRRPWHQLSIDELQEALAETQLCQRDHWANFNADQLAELYNSEITSVLDRLISAKTVTIRRRPSDNWFDGECRQSKREVRRLECSSRRLNTSEATAAWYSKRHEYRALLRRKRECFWQATIEAEKSKPGQLWRSIDALLRRWHWRCAVSSFLWW